MKCGRSRFPEVDARDDRDEVLAQLPHVLSVRGQVRVVIRGDGCDVYSAAEVIVHTFHYRLPCRDVERDCQSVRCGIFQARCKCLAGEGAGCLVIA